jgi:hypothetical protein
MSASLIILIPAILLGIVGMLCFVGCSLPVEGLPNPPFTKYSDMSVLNTLGLVAYWPLSDKDDTAPALERMSGIPSNYIDQTTAPSLYSWPPFNLPNPTPGNPDIHSADAGMGSILFKQSGIVKGDTVQPENIAGIITPCVVVNGCYVEVPFVPKLLVDTSFTIEAWVRVDWTANDPDAWRFVVDARDFPGKGFGLFAKTDDNQPHVYRWTGVIGNGGPDVTGFTGIASDELTITLGSSDPVYLALTYDGLNQTLTLFVNGDQQKQMTGVPYMPNTVQPLWIGAGAPYVTRRPMQVAGDPGSPLFPFVGAIQDVALYKVALDPTIIRRHFNNGTGTDS